MMVKIFKNVQNSMKLSVHRFLGSLNPNLPSNFQNSTWRIQYGSQNFEKYSELDEIVRTLVFLLFNLLNSKWRIQYGGPRFEKQEKSSMKSYIIMFLGSLNPNLLSDFQYPRLRIQYGV